MRALSVICLGALLLGASPTTAQMIDIDAIKQEAASKSDEFAELRALLKDSDVNLRIAAFDAMVAHGDASLYEIAVTTAIADIDEVVRARALWEILSRTRSLQIEVDPEGTLDNETSATLQDAYQGYMNFSVGNSLKPLNCINLYYTKDECVAGYNLSVSGTLVNFVYANQNVDGSFRLDGDGVLRGQMRNTRQKIEFPVAISLR